jgi:hypothetical protein
MKRHVNMVQYQRQRHRQQGLRGSFRHGEIAKWFSRTRLLDPQRLELNHVLRSNRRHGKLAILVESIRKENRHVYLLVNLGR